MKKLRCNDSSSRKCEKKRSEKLPKERREVLRSNPPSPSRVSVADLQKQLAKLQRAHDTNAGIFRDTLTALDSAIQAMSMALDAHISGDTVAKVDGRVDYNYYLAKFQKVLEEKPAVEESSIVSPAEDEVRIFGGV
jgi:hypothetical protein